jgi:hypothetical protein
MRRQPRVLEVATSFCPLALGARGELDHAGLDGYFSSHGRPEGSPLGLGAVDSTNRTRFRSIRGMARQAKQSGGRCSLHGILQGRTISIRGALARKTDEGPFLPTRPAPSPPARSLKGPEERFLPPGLSAGFRFSKKTFAGTRGNGRNAP